MEKEIKLKRNGFLHLCLGLMMLLSPLFLFFVQKIFMVLFVPLFVVGLVWLFGLFIVTPNNSKVLMFFGKYKGTIKEDGFFWANPFLTVKKLSLRIRNLETNEIKVNDEQGSPILISSVVVWKIVDTYKAVFDIEIEPNAINAKTGVRTNSSEAAYQKFVKIQSESALRNIAHSYPYDDIDDDKTKLTLRSGVDEINKSLEKEIRERLSIAGIEVIEARISGLSYAPEIASAMLQRQQAQAIIAARKKIVEGSVSIVRMALKDLEVDLKLPDDKKAAMISNLLVVLCSEQATTPTIKVDM